MDFWPENQGQSPLYSKFGTVSGRNFTHNHHDRHQVPHYPLYYGEQQNQGRESSYWTVPGSRAGGAPQEYTQWTDQDLTAATSSHFPFVLDRHTQQHQDQGDYQPHEARDREWTAAQQAAREYERGFLREGWQRRWEPCGPVRYNREVSSKRSDSSYRELEAWAARYSHSLPRRRRIEAELRGASQGLLESSRAPERDSRSGTDPRVAALQQVRQSANIRESGQWDRGGRQQAPTYYPSQTTATLTSQMLDIKEKIGYQQRMFSQPPGYIAPPPYDSPYKASPVSHHASWKQEGKRQNYWSQPTPRKQDVSVDVQDHGKGDKEEFTKSDGKQKCFLELEGLKQRQQKTDALQVGSPFSIQETHIQHEGMLSLQQPQVLQPVENKKINKESSSKVIEGRKFRLNKKTGGMTIFCLVSRLAGTTETPSLPLCSLQTNIENTELGGTSKGLWDRSGFIQTHKLADEVDFRAPTLTEQSNTSDAKNVKETLTLVESDMLEDNLSNTAETDFVSPAKANTSCADSTLGRHVAQSVQPVLVKYPLWREPSITSRAETESSSTCLKANSEEGESDVLHNQEESGKVHPNDVEVGRLDIKTDTQSEDSKNLTVIDTNCVFVKMEQIPSPKKEHVLYLHTEHSPLDIQSTVSPDQSNSQMNQDETTDQNTRTNPCHINDRPETELDSNPMEKKALGGESEISSLCMSSSSVYERETLEERAERILGIPLHDCITEQQPEDTSLLDSCVEDQKVEPSPIKDIDAQNPEDTREEELSHNEFEVGQTEGAACLQDSHDAKDQEANEGGGDFAGLQDQVSNMSQENIDSQLETDIKLSSAIEMTEDPLLKPACEEGTAEQEKKDNSAHHPSQCLSPPTDLSNYSSLSPSPEFQAPMPDLSLMLSSSDLTPLVHISESNIDEGPDPELIAFNSSENPPRSETSSLPQTPSPHPPGATDSPSSSSHTDYSPSQSPLDLIDQTTDTVSSVEDQVEDSGMSQLINSEISDEDHAKDMTEEQVSQQQFESGQPDDAACVRESNVTEEQQTKEAHKDPTDRIMEQSLKISKENAIEVNILQQQLECVQAEDVACVEEVYTTEEQLSKEVEGPRGLLEQTISQENMTDIETQTEVLQCQFDNGQGKDHYVKESYMTEEQSHKEAYEDPTGLSEQTLSTENDSQTQREIKILQDIQPHTEPFISSPPSDSDSEVYQSPLDVLLPSELPTLPHASNKSYAEFVSLLGMDSACPSALNPDAAADDDVAGIQETVPAPFHLDTCDESLQFSSSSCTDSPPVLPSSSSTPPQPERSGNVDPDLALKEEPQYPMSLWHAVNRIRKHTAPDSENEEEEVSELWDPESAGEDLGFPDVIVGRISEREVFDGAWQHEVSTAGSAEDVEVGQILENPCHEEPSGHAEDDTLSCSSASSHGSGDTVIVAEEDEEIPDDGGKESTTGDEEEFQTAEQEPCCSSGVKDESAAKEECPMEVKNITTRAVEMTETGLEENEEVASEVSDK